MAHKKEGPRPPNPELMSMLVGLGAQYEALANQCAKAGAYFPAAVMVGAALESALLGLMCSYSKEVWDDGQWPSEKGKPTKLPIEKWGLHRLITVANAMGWLSLPPTPDQPPVGHVIRFVQDTRNWIHPGRLIFEDRVDIDLNSFQEDHFLAVRGMLGVAIASLKAVVDK